MKEEKDAWEEMRAKMVWWRAFVQGIASRKGAGG
jgi:hypothetical protein